MAVEHVDPLVGEGPADRRLAAGREVGRLHVVDGRADGGLGQAVAVDHPQLPRARQQALGVGRGQRLAADQQQAQAGGALPQGVEAGEHRRHGRDHGDLMAGDQRGEGPHVEQLMLLRQDHGAARAQEGEHLAHEAGVGDRGQGEDAVLRRGPVAVREGIDQAHQAGVLQEHPLGGAGRAGGEDDARQVGRSGIHPHVLPFRKLLIETEDRRPVRPLIDQRQEVALGEQQAHPGGLDQMRHALARVLGVDRQVGAAGRQHAERSDQDVERALDAEAHPHLGPHAEPP